MDLRLVRAVLTAELAILPRQVRAGLASDTCGTLSEQLVVNRVMDALTKYENEMAAEVPKPR